jgi:NAD(P)-dependent dehydrogenase (short-subunit alcohol dehydrogenase family)
MPATGTDTALRSLFGLDGRVAIVPGGTGDIGSALAWGLARAGARVAVCARDEARAERLADELQAAGHDALGLAMDAHRVEDIRKAVDTVAAHFGALDLLVNCVGIQREERLLDVSEDAFDELLQVNLKGAMFLAQAVARHQSAAAGAGRAAGRQLHVLSVRAMLGMRDRGYSAYCATKGALVTLIRQHAVELSAFGVTVNGIAPTVVRGRMGSHWLANPQTREALLKRIPLGRVAEPEDLVGAALYFCSPAASFVTGQVLYLDGGITATQ